MTSEIDRLMSDLQTNTELQTEAREIFDIDEMAAFANAHGYSITVDELKTYDAEKSELSDEELDTVAGGAFVHSGGHSQVWN